MSASVQADAKHVVRVKKIKGLLTRFQAVCTSCPWESPLTTKTKALIGKQVHEGGGEVVSWTKARPKYAPCPDCLLRSQRLYETSDGEDLSQLPDVCATCNGSGKVIAAPVDVVH